MKRINILGTIIVGILLAGCASTTPPSRVEQALYSITTNYIPKVVVQTNFVVVDQVLYRTNEVGVPLYVTNKVTVEQPITNTAQVPTYTYATKDSVQSLIQTGGTLGNTFAPGIGSAVSGGLILLLGIWGHWRGNRNGTVAATLAQEVESIREYIKTVPNGTKMDDAITTWLKNHQQDTGTASTILGLLSNSVDNTAAKGAVTEIKDTLDKITKTG